MTAEKGNVLPWNWHIEALSCYWYLLPRACVAFNDSILRSCFAIVVEKGLVCVAIVMENRGHEFL